MKLITKEDAAREYIATLELQRDKPHWIHPNQHWGDRSLGDIYEEIVALGSDYTAINTAWRRDTFISLHCNECGNDIPRAIRLDEPDMESSAIILCRDCLTAAVALLAGDQVL